MYLIRKYLPSFFLKKKMESSSPLFYKPAISPKKKKTTGRLAKGPLQGFVHHSLDGPKNAKNNKGSNRKRIKKKNKNIIKTQKITSPKTLTTYIIHTKKKSNKKLTTRKKVKENTLKAKHSQPGFVAWPRISPDVPA